MGGLLTTTALEMNSHLTNFNVVLLRFLLINCWGSAQNLPPKDVITCTRVSFEPFLFILIKVMTVDDAGWRGRVKFNLVG